MKIIAWISSFFITASVYAVDITGKWYGMFEHDGFCLKLEFDLTVDSAGRYSAVMRSVDQSTIPLNADRTELEDDRLVIQLTAIGFRYEGRVEGSEKIDGRFTQGGVTFDLPLQRTPVARLRPQTPQPPYPYRSEEVEVWNGQDGIALAGTLTLPEGEGPFPAVLLVSGSGPQDRDETHHDQHKPFLVIADYLTRRGIAVLRCDDRGTAQSGGVYRGSTLADFTSDAFAGLDWLRALPSVDRIGVVGHSLGGCVAFEAAAAGKTDFIVTLAGPGIKGSENVSLQRKTQLWWMGLPEAAVTERTFVADTLEALFVGIDDRDSLLMAYENFVTGSPYESTAREIVASILNNPEFQSILRFDPELYYPRIACPVLALNGEKDYQVPAGPNLGAIENGLRRAGNQRVRTIRYPDHNHFLQKTATGLHHEYPTLVETIDPLVPEDIAEWILSLR